MQDTLISFKTAVLAKEKEFQEYTEYFYTEENGLCTTHSDGEVLLILNDDLTIKEHNYNCNGEFWYNEIEDEEGTYFQTYDPIKYLAPTQSLLAKWLREKHGILVNVITANIGEFVNNNIIFSFKPSIEVITEKIGKNIFTRTLLYDKFIDYKIMNYHNAFEKGLYEGLKLI